MNEIKYRVLRCAEELAKVRIEEVAKIAAMLVHNASSAVATKGLVKKDGDDEKPASGEATPRKRVDEENPLVEATAKAFELLEIAYYGNFELKNTGSYEAGLANFVEGMRIDEEGLEAEARLPGWQTKYGEDGKPEPVPFDEGLEELMPELEKADRKARFKAWLRDRLRKAKPEQSDREGIIEAEESIAEMKKNGISRTLFGQACVTLNDDWWNKWVSEQRSASGRKGGRPKRPKAQAAQRKSPKTKTAQKLS